MNDNTVNPTRGRGGDLEGHQYIHANLTTQQRSNAAAQRVRSEQPKVNDLDWTQTSSHTSARRGRGWTPTSFGYVRKLSYYGLTSVSGLLLLPGYHFCTVGQLKG